MKLLIIAQKYDVGDANLGFSVSWWDKLAERLKRVDILALEKRSEPTAPNMRVISMGKEKGLGFFGKVAGFYAGLFKIIRSADAILVHMIPKYVILAAPAALFFRKPIYMWYTGVSLHWQLRLAVFFCKKVFTAHEAAMRVNTPKRIVTGHGIDINKFSIFHPAGGRPQGDNFPNPEANILSVGRITPSKGHDLIIKAVSDLIKFGRNIELKIVGDTVQKHHQKYFEFLKKLAQDLQISRQVNFIGPVSYEKIPERFQNSQILVNATPSGGLDKVVLEAMAAGVIPLTSNGAFLSVFPPAFSAKMVFEENNEKDLSAKLKNILDEKLYQNEILKRQLREIVVQKHSLNNLIGKIIEEIGK